VAEPRRVTCRFAGGDDAGALVGVDATALVGVEGSALSAPRLAMLRIWLGLEDVAPDDDDEPGAPRAPPLGPLGYFLQLLLNGLVLGAIYCLIAVGYAQVFSLLEIVRAPLLGALPGLTIWLSAALYSIVLWVLAWGLFTRARGRIAFWI